MRARYWIGSVAWASMAASAAAASVVVEQAAVIPQGWNEVDGTVDPSERIRLSFALHQPAIDGCHKKILFGEHLTKDEAAIYRKADQDDVNNMAQWLISSGVKEIEPVEGNKDWLHVHTTVGEAEDLLEMQLRRYAFEDQAPMLRTTNYSIPERLRDAIDFVHPIANFMEPRKKLTSTAPPLLDRTFHMGQAPCFSGTSPNCIRELYNLNYTTPNGGSDIRFGIAGFLEQYANYRDLHQFLDMTSPDIASTSYNFSVELVNGGENSQSPAEAGLEAALDVDYAMALGYPTEVTYYSTGGRGVKLGEDGEELAEEFVDNEPYLELLEYLLDKPDSEVPHVLSISYADDELSVPRAYAERVCNLFGLLTARGTTILSGSGDGGARGARNSSCTTYDGSDDDVAMAVFPATCPWVTGVGATSNRVEPPEGAYYSGGGFSQYFPRPAWQDDAVQGYVEALDGFLEPYYNASMRATPDVAAIGSQFLVVLASQTARLQGTSASTPVVAAMIALINDARVRQGKKVLGWINELLYSQPVRAVLQDVKAGQSESCIFSDGTTPGGWPAKAGFDAITGLGVPKDFEKFLKVLVEA
ncbi:hypothetical protein S7711_04078 [Stachybotrys chartarum IBT 7711]|uniref:tripeptidyl-peptidase II n=1 Tax=Stachybotrys chartarum (strain CBS 109288 / IBT 7711) TaxID=1280523 RepID=A0A084AR29_STACB|nr:hypothetical protein S7711_04078 [Stachybotrys chartarum IBT 7711]